MRYLAIFSILLTCVVSVAPVHAAMSIGIEMQNVEEKGVLINKVSKDGAAYLGGLQPNDIIIAIGNKETHTFDDVVNKIQYSNGSSLPFLILRDGKQAYFVVRPEERDLTSYTGLTQNSKKSTSALKELADSYYNKKDYANAAKYFQQAANRGNAYAQYITAWMLQHKQGFIWSNTNYQTAANWYEMAAKQGHSGAQNELAEMYFWGNQIEQDYSKAINWTYKAANQGYIEAQFRLGYMYGEGKGIKENNQEAIKWYEKAANQGHMAAQYNLGIKYQHATDDFSSDLDKALYWYRKAANQGYIEASEKVAQLENPLYQALLGIRNIVVENKTEAIEFVDEHKEEIITTTVVIATAGVMNELSVDNECFRPNDDCNGYQLKRHKTFYGRLKRHISSYKPSYEICDSNNFIAKYLNRITENFAFKAGGLAMLAFDGNPEILIDLEDLRSELDNDGYC